MRDRDENNPGLNPADRELETALAGLSPARADRVDPISAAFAAGRSGARRQARRWRYAAVVMLVIAAGGWLTAAARIGARGMATRPEGTMMLVRSHDPPAAQQRPQPAPAQSWLMLRGAVLDGSLERLPASPTPATQTMRAADVL
jgi:hypothetical protein